MSLGFIILRHINGITTSMYWIRCYMCIRKFYPYNPIMIIDDNSNYRFVDRLFEKKLINTKIIRSEYVGRGELLPYIYYLRNRFCEKAVFLHDSVFLNKPIELDCKDYKFLWEFEHGADNVIDETRILGIYNDSELIDLYNNKSLWKGCFGGMMIISYKFLEEVNKKYEISKLIDNIKCRKDRMCFERIIACIFQISSKKECLLGNISTYCKWGGKNPNQYLHLPIIKIWTGR